MEENKAGSSRKQRPPFFLPWPLLESGVGERTPLILGMLEKLHWAGRGFKVRKRIPLPNWVSEDPQDAGIDKKSVLEEYLCFRISPTFLNAEYYYTGSFYF